MRAHQRNLRVSPPPYGTRQEFDPSCNQTNRNRFFPRTNNASVCDRRAARHERILRVIGESCTLMRRTGRSTRLLCQRCLEEFHGRPQKTKAFLQTAISRNSTCKPAHRQSPERKSTATARFAYFTPEYALESAHCSTIDGKWAIPTKPNLAARIAAICDESTRSGRGRATSLHPSFAADELAANLENQDRRTGSIRDQRLAMCRTPVTTRSCSTQLIELGLGNTVHLRGHGRITSPRFTWSNRLSLTNLARENRSHQRI